MKQILLHKNNKNMGGDRKKSPTQKLSHPSSNYNHIQQLHSSIGNQAVQKLFEKGAIQVKLKIGKSNDQYEQEADRVARQIMCMPESGTRNTSIAERQLERESIQKNCVSCARENNTASQENRFPFTVNLHSKWWLQTKSLSDQTKQRMQTKNSDQTSDVDSSITNFIHILNSRGNSLSNSDRDYFEPRFGMNFSQVRIHTDDRAGILADSVNAKSFTLGQHVVFGRGHYRPNSTDGRQLMAHELTHVVQNQSQPPAHSQRIQRSPDEPKASTKTEAKSTPTPPVKPASTPAKEIKQPKAKLKWTWKDLAAYPLFVDVWKDLISKKLTTKERDELKLTGTEAGGCYAMLTAIFLPFSGAGGEKYEGGFGKKLETWQKYTEALEPVVGSKSAIMDCLSRFIGLRLDTYLKSDLFKARLKTHVASVTSLVSIVQAIYSIVQGVKEPSAEAGEMEPTQWEKQFGLLNWFLEKVFKDYMKAPDFFDVEPLHLKTHPAFAAKPFAGEAPPSGLKFEYRKGVGEGEGGLAAKGVLTLNLARLIVPFTKGAPPNDSDILNLEKYRAWQSSLWFSYDKLDPTASMAAAGRLAETKLKGGALFGYGGYLGMLEAGARLGGEKAQSVTSWFLKGGFGYSWKGHKYLKRMGFTATFTDWKETDILAPVTTAGTPTAGWAARFTPFAKLEFPLTKRHKLGVGAALSFVTGSDEPFNVSSFRGDLSYIYMGDTSPDAAPLFKLDFSGSFHRLDWFDPKSPLMWGVQTKARYKQWFGGAQVMGGAGGIPEARARIVQPKLKITAPTTLLIIGGYLF